MSLEPIGLLTLFIGVLCIRFGPRFSIFALLVSMLFGAATVANLSFLGGANLPPAQLLLGFVAIDLLLRPKLLQSALGGVAPFRAGFWLLLTVCYVVPTAIIMPRLFAGATNVFAIGQSDAGVTTILLTPLAPVSGNITQTIYFVGDLVCFIIFYAYARGPLGASLFARAVIVMAFVNVAFACLDLLTFFTNTANYLDFIRNASYRMLTDVETAGF